MTLYETYAKTLILADDDDTVIKITAPIARSGTNIDEQPKETIFYFNRNVNLFMNVQECFTISEIQANTDLTEEYQYLIDQADILPFIVYRDRVKRSIKILAGYDIYTHNAEQFKVTTAKTINLYKLQFDGDNLLPNERHSLFFEFPTSDSTKKKIVYRPISRVNLYEVCEL